MPGQDFLWLMDRGEVKCLIVSLIVAAGFGWYLAFALRRRAFTWQARANLWFERATAMGWDYAAPLSEKQAERLWRDLFPNAKPPVKAPRYAYPMDLVIGTLANPIVLDRSGSHPYRNLDDTARASTVEDLLHDCGLTERAGGVGSETEEEA